MSFHFPAKVFSAVLLVALVSGCATSSGRQTTIEDMFRALFCPQSTPPSEALITQLRDSLDQQQPDVTFNLLQQARASDIPEKDLAPYYPATFNPLLDKADAYRAVGNSAQAGKVYRSLLAAYPDTAEAAKDIRMSSGSIYQQLKKCADDLMQQGLVHYRAGRLETAIETWNVIEEFLPEHQPSQTAIETTRTQLQTLHQLDVHRQSN